MLCVSECASWHRRPECGCIYMHATMSLVSVEKLSRSYPVFAPPSPGMEANANSQFRLSRRCFGLMFKAVHRFLLPKTVNEQMENDRCNRPKLKNIEVRIFGTCATDEHVVCVCLYLCLCPVNQPLVDHSNPNPSLILSQMCGFSLTTTTTKHQSPKTD